MKQFYIVYDMTPFDERQEDYLNIFIGNINHDELQNFEFTCDPDPAIINNSKFREETNGLMGLVYMCTIVIIVVIVCYYFVKEDYNNEKDEQPQQVFNAINEDEEADDLDESTEQA